MSCLDWKPSLLPRSSPWSLWACPFHFASTTGLSMFTLAPQPALYPSAHRPQAGPTPTGLCLPASAGLQLADGWGRQEWTLGLYSRVFIPFIDKTAWGLAVTLDQPSRIYPSPFPSGLPSSRPLGPRTLSHPALVEVNINTMRPRFSYVPGLLVGPWLAASGLPQAFSLSVGLR